MPPPPPHYSSFLFLPNSLPFTAVPQVLHRCDSVCGKKKLENYKTTCSCSTSPDHIKWIHTSTRCVYKMINGRLHWDCKSSAPRTATTSFWKVFIHKNGSLQNIRWMYSCSYSHNFTMLYIFHLHIIIIIIIIPSQCWRTRSPELVNTLADFLPSTCAAEMWKKGEINRGKWSLIRPFSDKGSIYIEPAEVLQ